MSEIINDQEINGVFEDFAEGDMDFFSYWYSICYMTGMMSVFRKIFRDIEDYDIMLRKFLASKGISFVSDSTHDILVYLYNNWVPEINSRGTYQINDFIGKCNEIGVIGVDSGLLPEDTDKSGIGIWSAVNNLKGQLDRGLNIGQYHEIEFDILLTDMAGDPYDVSCWILGNGNNIVPYNGVEINKVGNANEQGLGIYRFTYYCGGVSVSNDLLLDIMILNHIKITKYVDKVNFYVNGELLANNIELSFIGYDYQILYLFDSKMPLLSGIKVTVKNSPFNTLRVYEWKCNEGSGFIVNSNSPNMYFATLDVKSYGSWSDVWMRDSRLSNNGIVRVNGELRRLINHKAGEYLFELISASEMGFCLDVSSPLSEEASCKNLNKAYEKGEITNLSKFPLSFFDYLKPVIEDGWIVYHDSGYEVGSGIDWLGINAALIDTGLGRFSFKNWKETNEYKPLGQIPFLPIPVDTRTDIFETKYVDGYEISFLIRTNNEIRLFFGLSVYDSELNLIEGTTTDWVNDSVTDRFYDSGTAVFTKAVNQDLWVRGVYFLARDFVNDITYQVPKELNIGVGSNLYNTSLNQVAFIAPVIAFKTKQYEMTSVYIKDVVVRPLNLDSEKGVINHKNKMIGFMKNDSGQSNEAISNFIEEKLIPYNCCKEIKFL